jgi:hypothetical protein
MSGGGFNSSGGGASLMPKGTDKGWELASSFVSPFLGAVEDPDAPIEFGEFIGAGSFGRVYRGRCVTNDASFQLWLCVTYTAGTALCLWFSEQTCCRIDVVSFK